MKLDDKTLQQAAEVRVALLDLLGNNTGIIGVDSHLGICLSNRAYEGTFIGGSIFIETPEFTVKVVVHNGVSFYTVFRRFEEPSVVTSPYDETE